MKKIIILTLIITAVHAFAKDYHKTEEMIDIILKEQNSSEIKKNPEKINDEAEKTGNKDEEQEEVKNKNSAMSGKDEVLLKTGIQLYENGLYDHSLARFNDLTKNYPSSRFIDNARIYSGKIYIKKYRYDDAIKQFDSIGEQSGEFQAALYYKAESFRFKGDSISAIENYRKLSSSFPDHDLSDNAILAAGNLFLKSGKGYQALESSIRIIRYYKDRDTVDDAYYLIAKIYEKDLQLKDLETARKFYRLILKKSDEKQKYFIDSPIIPLVKKDLEHLEKTYFKFEQ